MEAGDVGEPRRHRHVDHPQPGPRRVLQLAPGALQAAVPHLGGVAAPLPGEDRVQQPRRHTQPAGGDRRREVVVGEVLVDVVQRGPVQPVVAHRRGVGGDGLFQGHGDQTAGVGGQPRRGPCGQVAPAQRAQRVPDRGTHPGAGVHPGGGRHDRPELALQQRSWQVQRELHERLGEVEGERFRGVDHRQVAGPEHGGTALLGHPADPLQLEVGVVAVAWGAVDVPVGAGDPLALGVDPGQAQLGELPLGHRTGESVAPVRLRGQRQERLADELAPVGETVHPRGLPCGLPR